VLPDGNQVRIDYESDRSGGKRRGGVTPAAQCARRQEPDQDVAQHATAQCGYERKHHNPEQVEMAADGRESAFQGEDECARKIRYRYEQVLPRDTALRDRWIHSLATTDLRAGSRSRGATLRRASHIIDVVLGVPAPGALDAHPDDFRDLSVHAASVVRLEPASLAISTAITQKCFAALSLSELAKDYTSAVLSAAEPR
jgi:hypothetical protein